MRIAKAVAGTIGSALVGLIITALAIPEWALDNLSQHAFQTVIGFLISAAFGGAVVFIIYATYMNWKLGSKPCKAFDNLRDIDELGECKSLADMVEPVRKLASKDVEIAELEKRPEQSAEEQKVKSILVSLDPDKLGLVGMVLARGSIDEHAEKGNRAFLVESGILARVEPSAIEAFASYTLTSIASAVIAGDEALRESAMKQGQELAGRIEERSERAREELNAQRRLTETAARVPELERRAETAEEKLREYESEFDLRRFSPEQKRAMLKCWAIEQHGEEGGVMAEWDNPVCEALVEAGVFRCSMDRVRGWDYQFNFEPKWRRYLAEHIGELESEAGPAESLD